MIGCTQCGSTSILEDEVFRLAGTAGVMQDAPSLVTLGQEVRVDGLHLVPVGQARFSYGRGWWDEFWCLQGSGDDGCWLSIDEGDYAVEWPLDPERWPDTRTPTLGQAINVAGEPMIVTEAENATCLAVRGEFPEVLDVGETHLYFDLSGRGGSLATYEVWTGGRSWTLGFWIDPWDVKSA